MRQINILLLLLFLNCVTAIAQSLIELTDDLPDHYYTNTIDISFSASPDAKLIEYSINGKSMTPVPTPVVINKTQGLYSIRLTDLPTDVVGKTVSIQLVFMSEGKRIPIPISLTYYLPTIKPILIGISQYREHSTLAWSYAGATHLKQVIESSKLVAQDYRIESSLLIPENRDHTFITRDYILGQMEELVEDNHRADVYFIYLSGHGEYSEKDKNYFFITSDEKRISQSEICNFIESLWGSRVFLFIDTCKSGYLLDYLKANVRNTELSVVSAGSKSDIGDLNFFYSALGDALEGKSSFTDNYNELSHHSIYSYIKAAINGNSKARDNYSVEEYTSDTGQFVLAKVQPKSIVKALYVLPFSFRNSQKYPIGNTVDWITNASIACGLAGGIYSSCRYINLNKSIKTLDASGESSLKERRLANDFYNAQWLYAVAAAAWIGKIVSVVFWPDNDETQASLMVYPKYTPMLGTSLAFVYTF